MNKKWKNWFGVLLSLSVALMPFLGFPKSMEDLFYNIVGVVLLIIFFMLAGDKAKID